MNTHKETQFDHYAELVDTYLESGYSWAMAEKIAASIAYGAATQSWDTDSDQWDTLPSEGDYCEGDYCELADCPECGKGE